MNAETEKVLRRDTIAETEKMVGKHWSKFDKGEQALALLNAMMDNEDKANHLKKQGDTHYGMKWDDFKALLVQKGFKQALVYDFKHDESIDEFIIYYHLEKGLIVKADSYYNKEKINDGTLYGEIQANDEESARTVWQWMSTGGCIDVEKLIFETSQDVREGLFSKLDTLETAGKFLNRWSNPKRFLWLLDFTEHKDESYDYKKITNEKIKRCPVEMQEIIGNREA